MVRSLGQTIGVVRRDDPFRGSLDGIDDKDFPSWLDAVAVGVAVVLGVIATVAVPADARAPVGALMVVAVLPFVIHASSVSAPWLSGVTLAALAVVNIGGWEWGWLANDAGSQASLLLGLWLVLCDAAVDALWRPVAEAAVLSVIVLWSAVPADWGSALIWLPGIALCLGGGRVLHNMAWNIVRVRAAEAQLARQAVALEQRRVAREVHDVVAHSLSVTALQLSAARMAADRGDLAATREALGDAERLTRTSLDDLRSTLRLLRESNPLGDSAPPDGAPGETPSITAALPGLAEVDALVASFRSAGMDVTLASDLQPGSAEPLVELTAYRVVQEALTNAARHQEAPLTAVSLTVDRAALRIEVTSRGPSVRAGEGAGHGLIGMRERVEALEGTLAVGRTDDGWRVAAALPTDGAEHDLSGPSVPAAVNRLLSCRLANTGVVDPPGVPGTVAG